jgi:murein L,D-transpeptidase YafK
MCSTLSAMLLSLVVLLASRQPALGSTPMPLQPLSAGIFNEEGRGSGPVSDEQRLSKQVDSIVLVKRLRVLMVFTGSCLQKVYHVALGGSPIGSKHFEGDEKTPEGLYYINGKNPHSAYHRNLGISYPNSTDREYARVHGRRPGGDLKIHGLPNGKGYIGKAHLTKDWTWGCIALTDEEVDELYQYTAVGVPIMILP